MNDFRAHRCYRASKYAASKRNLEKEVSENQFNQKILDSILDDDDEQFSQHITEISTDLTNINKTFRMTNYKIPAFLMDNPTYASLCACFASEKCFNTLSMLLPAGPSSDEMKKLDDFNRSPMHFACIGGSLNIIRELEQAGFDLNCRDKKGFLPSHYAAMFGKCDVIKYLWTKGSDVISLSSPVFYQMSNRPIELACLHGNLEIVRFICETVLADNEKSDTANKLKFADILSSKCPTPLHYACIGGHDNIVNYFLSKREYAKCQINALDNESRNPLLCACHNGSLGCIKLLLNYDKSKINLCMKGRKHLPLVDAAEGGFLDVVQFLLKHKEVKVQQETSQKVTALDVAVSNDYIEIVKLLIQNGAAKDLYKQKIVELTLTAIGTNDVEMIRYLDKVLKIPYFDMNLNGNPKFNYTNGDEYMEKACLLENKEMVNFLLDKKCTFRIIEPSILIRRESFDFLNFLIEKGLDISEKNEHLLVPPVVSMIRKGSYSRVVDLVSKGAAINKEIINKYNLIRSISAKCDLKLFNYVMSFDPDISDQDYEMILKNAIIRYYSTLDDSENETYNCLSIIEEILKKSKIDLNNAMVSEYESFISFAANRKCLKILDIFEKYGANFVDCGLNYDRMIEKDSLEIFNYFKNHGCKFDCVLKRKNSTNKSSKIPFKVMLSKLIFSRYYCIDTLLFIMDYTNPKHIVNSKILGHNIIDVFVRYNSVDGILKAYKITNSVFYPLFLDKKSYEKWVNDSKNAELINFVISS